MCVCVCVYSGHYTNAVKVGQMWYRCDDTDTQPISEADVLSSNQAYILFYLRNDAAARPSEGSRGGLTSKTGGFGAEKKLFLGE